MGEIFRAVAFSDLISPLYSSSIFPASPYTVYVLFERIGISNPYRASAERLQSAAETAAATAKSLYESHYDETFQNGSRNGRQGMFSGRSGRSGYPGMPMGGGYANAYAGGGYANGNGYDQYGNGAEEQLMREQEMRRMEVEQDRMRRSGMGMPMGGEFDFAT